MPATQPFKFTKQDEEKQNRWKTYNAIFRKYINLCHSELLSGKRPEVSEYLKKEKLARKK